MKKIKKPTTNTAIIKQFLSGVRNGQVNHLEIHNRVDSIALLNYNTVLLEYQFFNKTLHINTTEYSGATTKVQKLIQTYIPYAELKIDNTIEYNDLPQGTLYLFN